MGGYEMQDDLAMLDQELNMTRRATRPFVPTNDSGYFDLQRQVNLLANMPTVPVRRPRMEEPMGTDQLAAPKKIEKRSEVEAPKQAGRQQVRIADQIAIRLFINVYLPSEDVSLHLFVLRRHYLISICH